MNFETNSSSGDGDGYYSTLVDNEFVDFSANPLINGTIESFNGEMLPLKINNSTDIVHTSFLIFSDVVVKSLQVMLPSNTKIKWTATLF